MNLRRNAYKSPHSLKRTACKENRINKMERNLILYIERSIMSEKQTYDNLIFLENKINGLIRRGK